LFKLNSSTYFVHFDVSILNKLTNNVILALNVYSPLARPMILCIGDGSLVVTVELHEVYNARNNNKLIDELPYLDSYFACLASSHILSLHSGVSRTVLFGTLPTDSSIEHVYVPYL
jgi:hypothetical protein